VTGYLVVHFFTRQPEVGTLRPDFILTLSLHSTVYLGGTCDSPPFRVLPSCEVRDALSKNGRGNDLGKSYSRHPDPNVRVAEIFVTPPPRPIRIHFTQSDALCQRMNGEKAVHSRGRDLYRQAGIPTPRRFKECPRSSLIR